MVIVDFLLLKQTQLPENKQLLLLQQVCSEAVAYKGKGV